MDFSSDWVEEPTKQTETIPGYKYAHQAWGAIPTEIVEVEVVDLTAEVGLVDRIMARVRDMLSFGFDIVKRPTMDVDGSPTLPEIPAVEVEGGDDQ